MMLEEENNMTEDELIDAAMAAMDLEPLPTVETMEAAILPVQQGENEAQEVWTPPETTGSPTLDALDESRRPKARTVCERCPNSVWFASPAEVKCYCRVMFLVTWSSKEPNQITNCDGEFLGQEE
ncbi:MAG: hypothetical protein ACRCXB_25785, partial [Aeromonadaceae bacterium]